MVDILRRSAHVASVSRPIRKLSRRAFGGSPFPAAPPHATGYWPTYPSWSRASLLFVDQQGRIAAGHREIATVRASEVEMNAGTAPKPCNRSSVCRRILSPETSVEGQAFQKRSHLAQNERLITDEEEMVGARHIDRVDRRVGAEQAANSPPG